MKAIKVIRRLLFAIPTLLVISLMIFTLLDLAPGDPTGQLPMTIDAQTRAKIRESLGMGQPFHVRYLKWLEQFMINEPLNLIEEWTGATIEGSAERMRVRSWATRSPVIDLIADRLPQTLKVVGLACLRLLLMLVRSGRIMGFVVYLVAVGVAAIVWGG